MPQDISLLLPVGTMLRQGAYRIERHLASGGFGNTYLATDVNLEAKVAIKEFYISTVNIRNAETLMVEVSNATNEGMFNDLRTKFKKEAQRIFKIQHNNVVGVHALFEELGTVYYAMDFVQGESLNDKLQREGALDESLVRSVLNQMLDALEVVHQAGILHLDIKPHNIMLTNDGVAKLIDFGASKHANRSESTTLTGFAFTPQYAAPELINQEYDGIGPGTDFYSLGITLYRLLTDNEIPSKRDIKKKGADAFVYPNPVSKELQNLIVALTLDDIDDRPHTADEVRTLLHPTANEIPYAIDVDEAVTVIEETKVRESQPQKKQEETVVEPQYPKPVERLLADMVKVEGGTFLMGDNRNWFLRDSDAEPHQVTVSTFSICKYPVTQALWQAVMGKNPSRFKGDRNPVERVSWNECQTFIKKLNALTGQQFRLPTEAEWEFAARGGNKSKGYKYSGSNNIDQVAWYDSNSGSGTHPVAQKSPNELGLYDMSGNVWEWCQDWYSDYYKTSPSTNPQGPSSGSSRVLRGGSWYFDARGCRVSDRYLAKPGNRYSNLGLRLAY